MHFEELGLHPDLLRAVQDCGYTEPTPIQTHAIPLALRGRDIVGRAQTGTGKTAAFVLPILQKLHEEHLREKAAGDRTPPRGVRALVLVPTRELAVQVEENCRIYGKYTDVRCGAVYGGVGYGAQNEALGTGVEIIAATPGRLLDHMERGRADLTRCDFLVLDEADRMLDMGFAPDIDRIRKQVPARRQSFLFSATIPPQIESLVRLTTRNAVKIEVGRQAAPAEGITHYVHHVARHKKGLALLDILRRHRGRSVLVFVRTRRDAERIGRALRHEGLSVARIHSDRAQKDREKAMASFKEGKVDVLVATDIASRGIDVEGIALVVNYDVPEESEIYIHRIGRTARADAEGEAVTLVAPEELPLLHAIENLLGSPIESREIPHDTFQKAHLQMEETHAPPPTSAPPTPPPLPPEGNAPPGDVAVLRPPPTAALSAEPGPGVPSPVAEGEGKRKRRRRRRRGKKPQGNGSSMAAIPSNGNGTTLATEDGAAPAVGNGTSPAVGNGAPPATADVAAPPPDREPRKGGHHRKREGKPKPPRPPAGNRAVENSQNGNNKKKQTDAYGHPVHRNTHVVLDDDAWKRHLHAALEKDARRRGEPIPDTLASRAVPNERPWLLKKGRRRR